MERLLPCHGEDGNSSIGESWIFVSYCIQAKEKTEDSTMSLIEEGLTSPRGPADNVCPFRPISMVLEWWLCRIGQYVTAAAGSIS